VAFSNGVQEQQLRTPGEHTSEDTAALFPQLQMMLRRAKGHISELLRHRANRTPERSLAELNIQSILSLAPEFITRFDFQGTTFGGDRDAVRDQRITELNKIYKLEGKRILELGPLEGGHTLAMSRLGAREIVSVEGRPENFVKCSLVKSLYSINNANIVFGDLRSVDLASLGEFDICVCLGVLYHLPNPFRALEAICNVCDRVYIWTHCASDTYPEGSTVTAELDSMCDDIERVYEGKYYGEVMKKPQAGLQSRSFWLTLDALSDAVRDSGFDKLEVLRTGVVANKMTFCLLYAEKTTRANIGTK
jgi:2-polyprenyl-3-methyl-5-hydroxy-6-metoxy-1,4-benzoquinol methylase